MKLPAIYNYEEVRPWANYLLVEDRKGHFFTPNGERVSLHSINGDADQYEARWTVGPHAKSPCDLAAIKHFNLFAPKFGDNDLIRVPFDGGSFRFRLTQIGSFSGQAHYGFYAFNESDQSDKFLGWVPCVLLDRWKGVATIPE